MPILWLAAPLEPRVAGATMDASPAESSPHNRDKSVNTVSISFILSKFYKLSNLLPALLLFASPALADAGNAAESESSRPERQIILNGFRMPSIGLEYRNRSVSWHAGISLAFAL